MNLRLILRLLGVLLVLLGAWLLHRSLRTPEKGAAGPPEAAVPPPARDPERERAVLASELERARLEAAGRARLAAVIAGLDRADARRGEALLTFPSADRYRSFLELAAAGGLEVTGRSDALRTVRVRFQRASDLAGVWPDADADPADLAPNLLMRLPQPPPTEARDAAALVPLGNHLLEFLGVASDPSLWGRGVTVAVVDTGIAADPTFGRGRLRLLDIGFGTLGTAADDGHGTAVAALVGGALADAQGVAPAVSLLSIRVTDAGGLSDVFAVAQAIVAAVEQGAQIVNVSLGAYQPSAVLTRAIDYATAQGAVVVAAAGNDQSTQLNWPAADPRVVSVGAVDALGQQVTFSNSGPQLRMAAPGFGVQTAWADGGRVLMDGTSASAPIVAGAIAALVSNGGLTPAQAADVLQGFASEAGPEGRDEDFGAGVVNLGWALARNDAARVDTAIASHTYDPRTGDIGIVIQNRSARVISGLTLAVEIGAQQWEMPVGWLEAGATRTLTLPSPGGTADTGAALVLRTRLVNPAGLADALPGNNVRTSIVEAGGTSP